MGGDPGLRAEGPHGGKLSRIKRTRRERSGEEGRTLEEDSYNIPAALLPMLKYAMVVPPFLKCAGFYFLIFSSAEEEVIFVFLQNKVFDLFHFYICLLSTGKQLKQIMFL